MISSRPSRLPWRDRASTRSSHEIDRERWGAPSRRGDFNIPSLDSPLLDVLRARGLELARGTSGVHGSDLAQGKRYDQILHLPHTRRAFTDRGGVVDFYAGDHAPLFPRSAMTKREFTYELSDHLPL